MSTICLDCIGLIISYLESSRTLFNLLLLSKNIQDYICNEGHPNCINIIFNVVSRPHKKILYALNVTGDCFEQFVNLYGLHLDIWGEILANEIQNLKNLHILNIGRHQFITDKDISPLKRLKSLNLSFN